MFSAYNRTDGTIYFQDVNGHLYALRPDGSVKWIFQGVYPYGPVAVGADNTTYIASGGTIQAISPSGTLVWQFTDPDSQGVIGGPAVGPDGKIYAVMDLLGLGVIALSPVDGHLVWSNPGNPQVGEYGQSGLELVLALLRRGPPDQFYFACDNLHYGFPGTSYAFSLKR
jgi:outer membrane protein assembly factor BamB